MLIDTVPFRKGGNRFFENNNERSRKKSPSVATNVRGREAGTYNIVW